MIIKIILGILIFFFSTVFVANAIPAIIICKKEERGGLFNEIWLWIGGFAIFMCMMMFCLFVMDSATKDLQPKEKPQYELIQSPVYKQIK